MKRLLVRVVLILAIVEVSYLVIVNAVLNLPATQILVSQLRPDRFAVRWDFAWSWFPFDIYVRGISVNGQTWSQQFEISAPSLSASLTIGSLFDQTFQVTGLETADISVHLRPRPRPDRDDAALRQYYPAIQGRDPNLPSDPMPLERAGWKIVIDAAHIGGRNEVWLAAVRMTLAGEITTTVTIQNPHGPLTISGGQAELSVESFAVAGRQVADEGSIKGRFDVGPVRVLQNRGLKILGFASLDLDIDLPVGSFGFLDAFLSTVSDMTLGGRGRVNGHVAFEKGDLIAGTDLVIAADELKVALPPYAARGTGAVVLKVDPANSDTLAATVRFKSSSAFREPGHETLFTGADIAIAVARSTMVLPGANKEKVPRRVTIALSNVTVPDISAFQRYLPDKWDVEVLGGSGSLGGRAELSGAALDLDLTLRSDDAEVKFNANSFVTDVVFGFRAKGNADAETARVDISGTYLNLDDSRVKSEKGDTSSPWRTHLALTRGEAAFDLTARPKPAAGVFGFWSLFQHEDLKVILATVDGRVQGALTISDLGWLNLLFKNRFSLAVSEAVEVQADVTVRSGWLAEGSTVKSPARNFRLAILDYLVAGSGSFDLVVEKGGEHPDLRLSAVLDEASFRLAEEKKAIIEQVTLVLTAAVKGASLTDDGSVKTIEMNIPSAKVTDMTVYNVYLPKGSPLRILGGTADLTAKLLLQDDNASGFVKLRTSRLVADLDGQPISGVMTIDVPIQGGSARDKRFDISGASISIDHVGVVRQPPSAGDWSTRIDLRKARVTWKRPMSLDVTASIQMSDARPLLEIFADSRKEHRWLERLGDLRNIRADATIKVTPGEIIVPHALVTSEKISLGAKGTFREHDREGMFYARYGILAGILAFDGGQKRFKVINATRTFDEYVLGGPLPSMRGRPASTSPKAKKPAFSIFKRK